MAWRRCRGEEIFTMNGWEEKRFPVWLSHKKSDGPRHCSNGETPEDEKNLDPNKKENPGRRSRPLDVTLGSSGPSGYEYTPNFQLLSILLSLGYKCQSLAQANKIYSVFPSFYNVLDETLLDGKTGLGSRERWGGGAFLFKSDLRILGSRTSPGVQWLRLRAPNTGRPGFDPWSGN